MNSSSPQGNPQQVPEKTIDLQGVASFAGLVELLAQELGTSTGKMKGQLPDGPDSFNKLTGEIELNNQGFIRRLILLAQPGSPLTLRFQCAWSKDQGGGHDQVVGGITADYYLGASVEQIMPQGRALARYIEDIFSVMDRMVTLGHSQKLATMSTPVSQMEAFEHLEEDHLVTQAEEASASS
ncbi:MAG: hypothetical protein K8F91_27635 [Candidatus Obscuribacterales bacterium]|nr:hypothetical protein [Candidatus Obscuribacterales bacterium]